MDGEVESFSQPIETSTCASPPVAKKRTRNYSETLWPKRVKREAANTVFAMSEGAWDTLEAVNIQGNKYNYLQHHECDFDLTLCTSTFTIKSNNFEMNLPCRPVQKELFLKAKFLYEQVIALPNMKTDTDHKITCYARAAREANSESDGEDIPEPAILPAFNDIE